MNSTNKEAWTGGKNSSPEAMEKRKSINLRIFKFGCLPILVLFLLIGIISNLSDDSKTSVKEKSNEELKTAENSEVKRDAKTDLKIQIEKELASIDRDVTIGNAEDIAGLQIDLVLFAAYWRIVKEGELSTDGEIRKLTTEFKAKVISLQEKGFPILRQKYTAFAKELMWEHDIDVYASGNGRTLNLTGGIFAANMNIKQTQTTISENMTLFRFKKVQYRWYKDEDEYTYYDVNSPKDTEPVVFEE